MTQDEMKKMVARAALDYVETGTIIGIGTGSTANHFIDHLAGIKGRIDGTVASSQASADRLAGHGIPVLDLNSVDEISVYVDGADESNHHLHLIKGGGGALTREKIVAACSRKFISRQAVETFSRSLRSSGESAAFESSRQMRATCRISAFGSRC